jgi:DNA-binding transcriptional LysR family regulator
MSYLPQLQTFLEVYRLGSITAAATALDMTQPGASQHIQILENKFGKSLFTRQARGVVATVFADDLAKKIATQFAQIEDTIDDLSFNEAALKGDVYIGGPVSYITAKLLDQLASLNQYQINCHFSFGGKGRIYALLNNHEIDLAITASKIESSQLSFEELGHENLILVAGKVFAQTHQLSKLKSSQILQKPIIAYDSELPLIRDFFGLTLQQALQIKPVFMVPDLRSVVDLVINNVGVSVLPEYLCETAIAQDKMVQIKLENRQLTNTIYMVSPMQIRQNQRVKFVKNFILNIPK